MFDGVRAPLGHGKGSLWGALFLVFAAITYMVPARAEASPAAIVVDADSGTVLYEMNARGVNYPASLTKMMTLYLLFEALDAKKVRLDDVLTASDNAASQPATDIGLRTGDQLTVEKAIEAIVVQSANDAAVVVGESLGGGSESSFAALMTAKAKQLGMTGTVFRNASGLPDPNQITNAVDMSILARALIARFPQYYAYFSIESFSYHGRLYLSHNRVLKSYPGADGLKTGYTRAAGYNLATSAKRDGHRIVAVVLGGKTARKRDMQMAGLLDQGFGLLSTQTGTLVASAAKPSTPALPGVVAGSDAATTTQTTSTAKPGAPLVLATSAMSNDELATTTSAADPATPSPAETAHVELASATNDAAPETDKTPDTKDRWGIQVGAFGAYKPAHAAALRASRIGPRILKTARLIVDEAPKGANKLYRARLIGLSRPNAQLACRQLKSKSVPCLVFQADVTVAMNAAQ